MATTNGLKRSISVEIGNNVKLARQAKSIQEKDVGITSFLNDLDVNENGAFYGTIKQRYSDFLVNEIDQNGNVVYLLDEGIELGKTKKELKMEKRRQARAELQDKSPEEIEQLKAEKKLEEERQKLQEESSPKYELSDENREKLLKVITNEELKEMEDLFTNGGNMTTKTVFPDKQERTNLHRLIREAFQGKLETLTSAENNFKVALAKKSKNSRNPRTQESINHVDENGVLNYGLGPFKNYLHFTVYKENRETMEVASTIAKFLRIPSKSIRYGGTKDRRGITCQRFSIHKGKVARVSSLNKGLFGSVLGGFSYEDYPLSLGSLNGNRFIITIKDVKASNPDNDVKEVVAKCFESLKSKGYINYYGMQRFGSFSISTHVLGIYILQENWEKAVELILSEQEIVVPESVEARRIWAETKDPKETLYKMPRKCVAEYSILSCLTREKKITNENGELVFSSQSYFKALMSVPRNLRLMYVHAYQSFVWNQVVSKRIEMFGCQVQVGDLVIDKKDKVVEQLNEQQDEEFEEDVSKDTFVRAKPLTQEDIDSGKYTIYDVVLPLPGFDIIYPSSQELEQLYVDIMAKDGLNPHQMARRVREFSLAGSYRNIIGSPDNLTYKIVEYTNDDDPLVRTDLELLRLKKEAEKNGEDYKPERYITPKIEEGKPLKIAVIFQVDLGVSSYATMMMRELMKIDTSRFGESMFASKQDESN